ncbi:DUF1542 domain-containing protein [Sediminicola luteus]|uniref:DUF1542 domain-containing protein n=1 Tax=Sediminicola luteus TaxID=319238 RepID=A0A2A4GAN3_9FLAO|nr:DUF1542 domain-containing protein [Sediminicola luteus]PCE65038.1 hypothetical protein B7P33_07765 [Sediminicola luteus]
MNIALHYSGKPDYLNAISEVFNNLKNRIMNNSKLTEGEQNEALKEIENQHRKAKKEAKTNLY